MRKPLAILSLFCLCACGLLAAGCGDSTKLSAEEEAKMKKIVEDGNAPFDINKVPPEHRDKVRGFMGGNASAQPPSPGGTQATPTPPPAGN